MGKNNKKSSSPIYRPKTVSEFQSIHDSLTKQRYIAIDFLKQGIEQYNDGQFIWSKDRKTSLGADDGIGMAIVLAVLDSKGVAHGPLECLFTWNEEDGLHEGCRDQPPAERTVSRTTGRDRMEY